MNRPPSCFLKKRWKRETAGRVFLRCSWTLISLCAVAIASGGSRDAFQLEAGSVVAGLEIPTLEIAVVEGKFFYFGMPG
jgi:hypothetical protein